MDKRAWEALKARTYRHKPGPWEVWLFNNVFSDDKNKALAASAPDLLADVERLRAYLEHIELSTTCATARELAERSLCGYALEEDDAEVPE